MQVKMILMIVSVVAGGIAAIAMDLTKLFA